jgi:hypothetical protein
VTVGCRRCGQRNPADQALLASMPARYEVVAADGVTVRRFAQSVVAYRYAKTIGGTVRPLGGS